MKYIIMCGGKYRRWQTPRHLIEFEGEPLVQRTIRLLRECGVKDIAISSNDWRFDKFGVPLLVHDNSYDVRGYNDFDGYWVDAFYPTQEPTCYVFGDVLFSPEAIEKIVNTDTDDIQFFASKPPFTKLYSKMWAEPFALKVVNTGHLRQAIEQTKDLQDADAFVRKPIMWELWQVIKGTPLNVIDYTNYAVINDYTCDIDNPEEVEFVKERIENYLWQDI